MPLFEKKQTNILGIDVGTSSIKLIELSRSEGGALQLATYGFVDQFQKNVQSLLKEEASFIADHIALIHAKAGCTTKRATAALPTYAVFTSLISLPVMSKEELDSAVHWEAKKIIPLPLDDIILDYRVLNPSQEKKHSLFQGGKKEDANEAGEKSEKDLKIILTGAAKETVQQYTDIFQKSGLELVSLETEMFALGRALVGESKGEVMVVEIGAAVTDIIILENGVPFLGRSIEVGGNALTRAIMNTLAISEKRAEQMKRDVGIVVLTTQSGGIPQILKETLEPIVHEIKYTLELYKSNPLNPSGRGVGSIEKIILTGGSALMPHLPEYLSQALEMRVFVGDPWTHVTYPLDLKPVLATIGPKFSVAIGLALREP